MLLLHVKKLQVQIEKLRVENIRNQDQVEYARRVS